MWELSRIFAFGIEISVVVLKRASTLNPELIHNLYFNHKNKEGHIFTNYSLLIEEWKKLNIF